MGIFTCTSVLTCKYVVLMLYQIDIHPNNQSNDYQKIKFQNGNINELLVLLLLVVVVPTCFLQTVLAAAVFVRGNFFLLV